jgi:riboflavin kinase / FMN adenylyltransferase
MQHYYDIAEAQLEQPSLVTIGVFDGVHRGHQYLIRQLVERAHQEGKQAVALTFYPHPDIVLRGLQGRYYLTSPDARAERLGALGVDYVITQTFDEAFRQIRAAEYVRMMSKHLRLASLWVGSDFALGYRREGNVAFLREMGQTSGFEVMAIDLLMTNGDHTAISSTAIRQALEAGELEQANRWLGYSYRVEGEVVKGAQRGRTIGFPTANTAVWNEQMLPANGIYAGWAQVDGATYMAATNVGVRPTFDGAGVTVEPYLLDFDRDIYGKTLRLTFEKRLRPEQKYDSLDALIAQIKADVAETETYLRASAYNPFA